MRGGSTNLLDLAGRLYEAALDPTLWPSALTELTDCVGGAQVMMGVHDVPNRPVGVIAPRMAAEDLTDYRDHWGRGDILWQRTNRAPVGQVLEAERFVPRDEFVRTPIYNEWHRSLGIGASGLGVNLFYSRGLPVVCGIKRDLRRDAFSSDEVARFAALVPHLVRAVDVGRRLVRMTLALEASVSTPGHAAAGMLVVDRAGRLLHVGARARHILDARDGVRVDQGRLRATEPRTATALEDLIRSCTPPHRARGPGGVLEVARSGSRWPIRLTICPFDARHGPVEMGWIGLAAPVAIIVVTDPGQERRALKERLRARHGLTPAEGDVAAEIAQGDGREAAAGRLGISVGTVRTHLLRVFDKTGVRRQAELVRLLQEEMERPPG